MEKPQQLQTPSVSLLESLIPALERLAYAKVFVMLANWKKYSQQ
jgi:hypothetical protein